MTVGSYARPHLWANPDETLQGDTGGPLDVEPPPWDPQGGCHNFKKVVAEFATVEFSMIIMPTHLPLDVCRNSEYFSSY